MSDTIRIVLVIAAVIGFIFFMVNIRRSKLVIADSIYWFVFAAIVLILGLFPQIAFFFSRTLGVASASNLVYLVIIALLLFRIFQMDIKISQLNTKLQNLTQDTAILRSDYEQIETAASASSAEKKTGEKPPAISAPLPAGKIPHRETQAEKKTEKEGEQPQAAFAPLPLPEKEKEPVH